MGIMVLRSVSPAEFDVALVARADGNYLTLFGESRPNLLKVKKPASNAAFLSLLRLRW
ncbi:hypothetical protein [Maribacter polysaccharolyticus]|uniref:hypothetical protein n=1 Tax=Maribacter polysaccharolyticus TaxID=3020831 RepID=UPI00237FC11B|nr:hypothetical protein [Maribacter polysaccharolyticus]MDE3741502.1 hypothetical protein [Maribacter polysaccharolyticus]